MPRICNEDLAVLTVTVLVEELFITKAIKTWKEQIIVCFDIPDTFLLVDYKGCKHIMKPQTRIIGAEFVFYSVH